MMTNFARRFFSVAMVGFCYVSIFVTAPLGAQPDRGIQVAPGAAVENPGSGKIVNTTSAEGTGCTGAGVSWQVGGERARQEAVERAKNDALSRTATYVVAYNKNVNKVSVENVKEALSVGMVDITSGPEFSQPKADEHQGTCTTAKVEAVVSVDESLLKDMIAGPAFREDPNGMFNVRVWTDKREYRQGDKIAIMVKANKDFYLDLTYADASGKQYVLLPNKYRKENFFRGGQVHVIPGDAKEFSLEIDCVNSPCGKEVINATASTRPLRYDRESLGTPLQGVSFSEYKGNQRTRGIGIIPPAGSQQTAAAAVPVDVSATGEAATSEVVIFTRK